MLSLECHDPAVRVRCDEVLWIGRSDSDTMPDLIGMSIIGPEQAVRGIAAACSMKKEDDRPYLTMPHPSPYGYGQHRVEKLHPKWRGPWRTLGASRLSVGNNLMHLVALAPSGKSGFLAVPVAGESPARAVYRAALANSTSPLLPIDRDGRSEREGEIAEIWATVVGTELMKVATPAKSHPAQANNFWRSALWVAATQATIDKALRRLMKARLLPME